VLAARSGVGRDIEVVAAAVAAEAAEVVLAVLLGEAGASARLVSGAKLLPVEASISSPKSLPFYRCTSA